MLTREAVLPILKMRAGLSSVVPMDRVATATANAAFRTCLMALVVAASYYVGSRVGFLLTPGGTPISGFWPPNAILLCAFLLVPLRIWWVFVLAVLPAHFLVQLGTEIPLVPALGWFVGNTGEALLGAACVRFFNREKLLFESVQGTLVFLVFGVVVATLLTSFIDAANAVLTGFGTDYWSLWTARFTSNVIADITIVPAVVTIGTGRFWSRQSSPARYFEAAILAGVVVLITPLVFGGTTGSFLVTVCALLPLLLWAALRFGIGGLSLSTLGTALVCIWNAIEGRGLFAASPMPERLVSIQVFLILLAVPLMFVASEIAERRHTEETLQNTRTKLLSLQEKKFHYLAREVREDILQRLALVNLTIDEFQASDPSVKPALDKVCDQISEIWAVALTLSYKLHPFTVEYLGLDNALKKLCREISLKSGVAIALSLENASRLAPHVSRRVFRIAEAALQAVAQHSGARTARVEYKVAEGRALLRITNDGTKCSHTGEGAGLDGIREYVTSLNGAFNVVSTTQGATVIEASIPVDGA